MLRRFLAPQLADLIVAQGGESILESHRREIVVVFCDIRGFTAFAELAEPEEVIALLQDYHAALGPIIARFEGTLDHYSGDGATKPGASLARFPSNKSRRCRRFSIPTRCSTKLWFGCSI
jgi:class 3 adenylate cyclase